jgi:hypothetical protein
MNIERKICSQLVREALNRDYTVSVYDGEEWPLKRSTSHRAILAAMFSTDSDTLRFHDSSGMSLGSVLLIYGNGEDVIFDHSDNPATNALVEATLN